MQEQGDLFDGKRRRDRGAATALGVIPDELSMRLTEAIERAANLNREFWITHVYNEMCQGDRDLLDNFPNAIGGAIIAAARARKIESTGRFTKATAASARSRNVVIWTKVRA